MKRSPNTKQSSKDSAPKLSRTVKRLKDAVQTLNAADVKRAKEAIKAKESPVDLARIEYGKYVADAPVGAEVLDFDDWQKSKAVTSEAPSSASESNIEPAAASAPAEPTDTKAVAKDESKQSKKKAHAKPQKPEVVLLSESERRELRGAIALEHNSLRKEQRTASGKRLDEIKSRLREGSRIYRAQRLVEFSTKRRSA